MRQELRLLQIGSLSHEEPPELQNKHCNNISPYHRPAYQYQYNKNNMNMLRFVHHPTLYLLIATIAANTAFSFRVPSLCSRSIYNINIRLFLANVGTSDIESDLIAPATDADDSINTDAAMPSISISSDNDGMNITLPIVDNTEAEVLNETPSSPITISKPALVPLSWPETLDGLFNAKVSTFLVKSALLTNSNVFRIPLPIPWKDTIVVGDADLAKKILTDQSTTKPGFFYAAYNKITGNPTTFSLGDTSKRYQIMHASVLAPCMSGKEVERMRCIMDRRASGWIYGKLDTLAETSEPFDIVDELTRFIFDT